MVSAVPIRGYRTSDKYLEATIDKEQMFLGAFNARGDI
jgi:hypothetical protein